MPASGLTPSLRLMLSSAVGDPRSEHTWSGTVARLAAALEATQVPLVTFESDLRPMEKLALAALGAAAGLGRSYRLSAPARALAARRLAAAARRAGATHVLHVGWLDVPPQPSGLRHCLYADTTWNLWSRHARSARLLSARAARAMSRLERQAYARIEHFFCVSAAVRDDLIAHFGVPPQRATVVGTGRGGVAPYAGPKDYANGQILFVARHRFEDKGGPLLIEAFRIARRSRPELRLVIAGSEDCRPLEREVENLTVAGFLPRPDLERLFQQSALFALPAPSEPWGLVYLEALACRTPVLGLRRNGFPEIAGEGRYGFIVDEPDPAAVAAALVRALGDPARLAAMGAEGQEHCLRQYNWERVAARIVEVLDAGRA